MENYIVGENYRYSGIPQESTDDIEVNEYGPDLIGMNAIHLREHETNTNIWFIWEGLTDEAMFKCVYKF